MARQKYTYEQVYNEFDKRGYDLVSEEYHNVSEHLEYICRKHKDKGIQKITFSKLHSVNRGCYYCGRERTENAHVKELDPEYDKQLCESKNFTYIGSRKENHIFVIDFICNNHKDLGIQSMRRNNMKRQIKGCQYCSGKNLPEWYLMKKKDEVNPNIILIDPYKNMTTRMKCLCKKHNFLHNKTMQEILGGKGCYYCGLEKLSKQMFLSDDQVNENIHKKNPHVDVIKYNGADIISEWYCNKHPKSFSKCYVTLLYCDSGCDECYKELIRDRYGLGQLEFKKKIKEIHPTLQVIGKYINNTTPVDLYCQKHDCYFSTDPSSAYKRLSCCPKSRVTYKEEYVCSLLEKWGYSITRQKKFDDCKDKNVLPFDCYLNDFNVLVEYDGEGHYKPVMFGEESYEEAVEKFHYTQKHDQMKNEYCEVNNIPLIRIPYYEFDDVEYYLYDNLCKLGVIEENFQ